MYLVVDVGNSNITAALMENQNLHSTYRFQAQKDYSKEHYEGLFHKLFKETKIEGCMISSVCIELSNTVKNAIDNVFNVNSIFLDQKINIGINIDIPHPEIVGADRVANAYAALRLYGAPAIVVDMGTATTFEIIDKKGNFSGGIIMPGVGTQLKSLCNNTSLLPQIQPAEIDNVIGIDTKTCILSGVIRGHAAAIDGLLYDCKKEMNTKDVTVIGTGGYIDLVSKYMKHNLDCINKELTLQGIGFIYELNKT